MNPTVLPIDLWLQGLGVLVGVCCPCMREMITLVSVCGVVEDSEKTRGKLLDDGQVVWLISFGNGNILKDLCWKPLMDVVELYRVVASHC
uniref:Uncharacterized protein n=1 Tax=Arundo donax TaxID=35708 RepID=A0A0A9GV35_ARUDO